jgi:hypothetical protein
MRRTLSFLSFLRIASLAVPVLLGATALLAGPGRATAAAGPGRVQVAGISGLGPRPGLAARPAEFTGPGSLYSVAALSDRYAWAVGYGQVGSALRTIIEHWNGRVWQRIPSPNPPGNDSLGGVAVTSTTNAWAVGESGNRSLILHWNGKSWRQVPSPALANLASVAATSAANAWAVGLNGNGMVIEHWNGQAWRQVKSPVSGGGLYGVTATSANNAWAVGDNGAQMVILHWNGRSWGRVPAPSPKYGSITAVTATSAGNAWAVGSIFPPNSFLGDVLIEHWNGHTWRLDPASQPRKCGCVLLGVGASSARNAWAVGEDQNHLNFTDIVIEHWTGQRWRPVTSPVQEGLLDAVAATPSGRAWAVGSPEQLNTSLIITWNGKAWQ